jgi:hypothetical protein
MTPDQIVELVAPCEPSRAIARENLKVLGDALTDDIELVYDGVRKGFLRQTEILCDGKPAYMIFWHINDQGGFHLNCAVSLDMQKDNFPVLIKGFEKLAAQVSAKFIEFHTRRRGLLLKVREYGYRIENVQVLKIT